MVFSIPSASVLGGTQGLNIKTWKGENITIPRGQGLLVVVNTSAASCGIWSTDKEAEITKLHGNGNGIFTVTRTSEYQISVVSTGGSRARTVATLIGVFSD